MRRRGSKEVVVNQPGKGLLTNIPPDLQDNKAGQFIVSAKNVRAEDGQLKSAPGYERINLSPANLDSVPNLIHQANITSEDPDSRKTPIVGTESKLYTVRRRSRPLVCPYGCSVAFGAVGDSGKVGENAQKVAELIRSWGPDLVLHAGDLVYSDGGSGVVDDEDNYESQVARYYAWAMGAYGGVYPGGAKNIFYPVMGNHDWDDGPGAKYLGFFSLPGNEQYYSLKRGPVHFFFLDTYGDGPASTGPGGAIDGTGAGEGIGQADLSSTGPMAEWFREAIQGTDCPLRVVVMHHPPQTSEANYYPGYAVLDWPFGDWGVDLIITGHSHAYERITRTDGVTLVTVGTGGHSLRSFNDPLVTGSQTQVSKYGAFKGVATGNSLACEFIDIDGLQQDSFTISPGRGLSVCYAGDNARQVSSLVVRPATKTVSVGQTYPLDAIIEYTDGTTEVVTERAQWETIDSGIASVEAGKTTGVAVGTTTVTANYEGLTGTCIFMVEAACADTPLDLVVVFDRSHSMTTGSANGRSRIDRAKEGLGLLFDQLDPDAGDRIGFVHFGGIWQSQVPDVVRMSDLTTDYAKVEGLVQGVEPSGGTGLAAAVDEASAIFTEQHLTGYRKTILIFTDGYANILSSNPDPLPDQSNWASNRTAAMGAVTTKLDALKADDETLVIVVGLDVAGDATHYATVQSWASSGYYYDAADADQLVDLFATILQDLCEEATSGEGLSVGLGNV